MADVIMEQIMRCTAHVWITVIDLLSGVATPVVRSSGIVRSSLMNRPPAQKAASGAVWLTSSLTLAMLCGAYSKEAERMIDMSSRRLILRCCSVYIFTPAVTRRVVL